MTAHDLECIANEIEELLARFVDGGNIEGLILPTEHSASFTGRRLEAKSMLDEELGPLNDYSSHLMRIYADDPSYVEVQTATEVIRAGARAVERKQKQNSAAVSETLSAKPYVDPSRIIALQGLSGAKWDFLRLLELCREINVAWANHCHLSTAMLLRTILNHVPPVLGFATFVEVASNYGGSKEKSFKQIMQRLEASLRSIADSHLHRAIRTREDVPSSTQVDFAAELDLLLSEVIRVARN